MTDTPAIAEGRVARVVGPVVDVEFPPDRIRRSTTHSPSK